MKCKFVLLVFVVFILLTLPIKALQVAPLAELNDTFYPGDFVDLGIVLINNESRQINLTVEQYILYPELAPMPMYEEITIPPHNDTMITDMSFDVYNESTSGRYVHFVRIYEVDEIIAEKIRMFFVESGAQDKLSGIMVTVCADSECDDMRPVFVLGETAYIMAEADQNPDISGYVEFPDGNFASLQFADDIATFKAGSAGDYAIRLMLVRDGFDVEEIERNITFVKEAAKPTYYFCNETEDGVCEGCPDGEDPDCMKIMEANNFYITAAIMAAVIIIAGLLAFWIMKGKKGKIGA